MNSLLKVVGYILFALPHLAISATVQFENHNIISNPDFFTEFNALEISNHLPSPQFIDGFNFFQVNGDNNDIWTTYNPGDRGNGRSWYPNAGDNGFTFFQLDGSLPFESVSLFVGSGSGSHNFLAYELLYGSNVVQRGVLGGHQYDLKWLSITGGGFNGVRLKDGTSSLMGVQYPTHNALALDAVYATTLSEVPLPAGIYLFLSGLVGLGLMRGRNA